ncbi:MAG: hypothetical protein ABSH29_24240 [Acidimicrobiales bacterium]|jgi:hypothetical protein
MLVSFDIDCGYLVAGHRFIARGIADDGLITGENEEPYPGFSFEYELAPGVESVEEAGEGIGPFLVGIEYQADVALPWTPADGGTIAPFVGGPTTRGTRGSWPLPRDASLLKFVLYGLDAGSRWPRETPDGVLTVDLQSSGATFQQIS